ncbi:MAG TPA: hypothetical protein VGF01_21370 [Terracidiphilus sp.]|jgi:hypothetical protein
MSEMNPLIVAGSGEASSHDPSLFDARIRATIRYADPAAWITANAVHFALAGAQTILAEFRHQIGIITVSDQGPSQSMAKMQADGETGFSSPLHYAASGPWTLAGVSCIAFGLRGPTLNLTMNPHDGVPVSLTICEGWLKRKVAPFVVVAANRAEISGSIGSRAVLLASPEFSTAGAPLTESVAVWLAAVEPLGGASA